MCCTSIYIYREREKEIDMYTYTYTYTYTCTYLYIYIYIHRDICAGEVHRRAVAAVVGVAPALALGYV